MTTIAQRVPYHIPALGIGIGILIILAFLLYWYFCYIGIFATYIDIFAIFVYLSVPTFGIALAGSLRSPERFAPATIPVTAVKNTPNVSSEKVSNFHFFISKMF